MDETQTEEPQKISKGSIQETIERNQREMAQEQEEYEKATGIKAVVLTILRLLGIRKQPYSETRRPMTILGDVSDMDRRMRENEEAAERAAAENARQVALQEQKEATHMDEIREKTVDGPTGPYSKELAENGGAVFHRNPEKASSEELQAKARENIEEEKAYTAATEDRLRKAEAVNSDTTLRETENRRTQREIAEAVQRNNARNDFNNMTNTGTQGAA